MGAMDILYVIAMKLIGLYRVLSWIAMKIAATPVKDIVTKVYKDAGVTMNGKQSYDIQVKNENFYLRSAHEKSLGLGESYMDGWWDCERLDEFFARVLEAGTYQKMLYLPDRIAHYIQFDLFNLQTSQRSWEVAEKHYNLGKLSLNKCKVIIPVKNHHHSLLGHKCR